MANFLDFMLQENGRFYCRFQAEKGRINSDRCLYYPGEAGYALASLFELTNQKKWLNLALKTLKYTVKINANKPDDKLDLDHWFLLATSQVLKHYDLSDKSISRKDLETHAIKVIDGMLKDWYTGRFHIARFATRLEAVLSVHNLVPDSMQRKYEIAVVHGIQEILDVQIKSGTFQGGIPPRSSGKRKTELRIDHNQHAMSALIEYLMYFFYE